ncbi:MAG: hypothetical protein WAL91_00595 [Propionicimonas sp.]
MLAKSGTGSLLDRRPPKDTEPSAGPSAATAWGGTRRRLTMAPAIPSIAPILVVASRTVRFVDTVQTVHFVTES